MLIEMMMEILTLTGMKMGILMRMGKLTRRLRRKEKLILILKRRKMG